MSRVTREGPWLCEGTSAQLLEDRPAFLDVVWCDEEDTKCKTEATLKPKFKHIVEGECFVHFWNSVFPIIIYLPCPNLKTNSTTDESNTYFDQI